MLHRSQLMLRCVALEPFRFECIVAEECGGGERSDQVQYLAGYLRHPSLGVKTLLIEKPYVDRHYMEEYGRYYALSFRPPKPTTTRVHAFAVDLTDDQLQQIIETAAGGPEQRLEQERALQSAYRGFIVLRPLAAAPVGRTVLEPFRGLESRRFQCAQVHRVHLTGFELTVRGVPFQQQEQAVGACATTAIWSALAGAARSSGRRGPTPYEITEGATRHVMTDRQLPAQSGLNLDQVVAAVQACGFAPQVLKAGDSGGAFGHAVKCYLASGIPVVLLVYESGGYHAITAVGFRVPDDEEADARPIEYEHDVAKIRTTGLTRIYVHEDRLGPYSRMLWDEDERDGLPKLRHLKFKDSAYEYDGEEPMLVHSAVVPLYPKLRMTAEGLLAVAAELYPLMRLMVGKANLDALTVELRFVMGGQYLQEILESGGPARAHMAELARTIALPRYVGLVRFKLQDTAVVDVVCDSTDIFRDAPKFGSILALVPLDPAYASNLERYFEANAVGTHGV